MRAEGSLVWAPFIAKNLRDQGFVACLAPPYAPTGGSVSQAWVP